MPKLIQNITGSLVDNLKDTIHAIKFIESKFGYGDYFELGCYEAFLQDLRKVNSSEDLNQISDFGVANNRNEVFKVIEISEYIASSTCVPPTVFNGVNDESDTGGGQATFNLTSYEALVAPFDYTTATFEWYEDAALTIPIGTPGTFLTVSTTVYVKVTNPNSCYNIADLTLNVI
jgi:hypothetical protein